jgi:hypothetical protein
MGKNVSFNQQSIKQIDTQSVYSEKIQKETEILNTESHQYQINQQQQIKTIKQKKKNQTQSKTEQKKKQT